MAPFYTMLKGHNNVLDGPEICRSTASAQLKYTYKGGMLGLLYMFQVSFDLAAAVEINLKLVVNRIRRTVLLNLKPNTSVPAELLHAPVTK